MMFSVLAALLYAGTALSQQTELQPALLPAPNGTYVVGLTTIQLVDPDSLQPFAPIPQARVFELSVFYPSQAENTSSMPYMPPFTARYEDLEHSSPLYDLDAPNGTFERLMLQVAPAGSHIADQKPWPVLLFSPAQGTTRLFYSTILSHIASTGYVIFSFDTLYDVDIVELSNGTVVLPPASAIASNVSDATLEAEAALDAQTRAQDASFILDTITNNLTFVSSLIPNCSDSSCLNTTHAGIFGHSIGGAGAPAAMFNDSRFVAGINFDGEVYADVITQGLPSTDQSFMLMLAQNQTASSPQASEQDPEASWYQFYSKIKGTRYGLRFDEGLHYDYSDLPIVFETLGLTPSPQAMALEQITTLNGMRALNIVTAYTVAFFDSVMKGIQSSDTTAMLMGNSADFPELSALETGVSGSNATSSGTGTASAAISTFTSGAGAFRACVPAFVWSFGGALVVMRTAGL